MIPTSHDERAPRVLVADDDADVLAALKLLLRGEGFEVETATSPAQALAALEARDFDVALLDLNYARDTTSGREGLELLEQLRALDPTLPVVVMTAWGGALVCVGLAIERAVRPMQTIANMMAAIREGDTSIRARHADPEGALGLALFEINALTESVRRHRLGALAATTLLQRVMDAVDVAVFGFDAERRLRLVNGEGERLLGRPAERALGLEAAWLGLGSAFEGDTPRLLELRLGGAAGRWELRRGDYIQDGRPHVLLLLSDLSRALREEEREAWLRLIRVLSHEINNSLAPIQSIAGSLRTMIARGASTPEESSEGLQIIETRAQSLGRFMHAYARLARLPKPLLAPVDVPAWVAHGAALETRLAVEVLGGPAARVDADRDQLDQLLINLVRNATDAALETNGRVWLEWDHDEGFVELCVHDEGPGVAETANLFVPFFTTKPTGTGIGLALSRQIVEAHGGSIALENREADPRGGRRAGCTARVRLPLLGGVHPLVPGGARAVVGPGRDPDARPPDTR